MYFIQDNRDLIRKAFRWLDDNSGVDNGFTSQKSGFEALRMVLANNSGSDLGKACQSTTYCSLDWRQNSERVIVMVTDDVSDLPTAQYVLRPS